MIVMNEMGGHALGEDERRTHRKCIFCRLIHRTIPWSTITEEIEAKWG